MGYMTISCLKLSGPILVLTGITDEVHPIATPVRSLPNMSIALNSIGWLIK